MRTAHHHSVQFWGFWYGLDPTQMKHLRVSERIREIGEVQSDRKDTHPILKYLLMVVIQYNSIELINTQYRCDCTRAHAGNVML
jgi:hypothetical protein